jgi:sarcosine oxidase
VPAAGDRDIRPPGREPVTRTEFAVIGAGITGLAAAWALARRGCEVTVLDQAGIGNLAGGSHGACRIFRLGYEDPDFVSLAARARDLWTELEQAGGERLLHPTPQLTFGPQMPQVRAAMQQAGAACELLPPGEAAIRFPGLRVSGEVLLEPASAVIAADRALATLASLAGATGEIRTGVRASRLADDGRRVLVSTTAGDVEARLVIVCAGPWTAGLLAAGGVTVPGSATLEQVSYLAPATAAGAGPTPPMPIFVHYGGEFAYGLPVPGSDRYKMGIHHGGPVVDPGQQDQADDPGLTGRTELAARAFLPGFDPRPVAVERCVYDNSPDTDFIVDRIGNVVIGSGTSGHGFKFGPLLGEWLASLATSAGARPGPAGQSTQAAGQAEVPARFALARFKPDHV